MLLEILYPSSAAAGLRDHHLSAEELSALLNDPEPNEMFSLDYLKQKYPSHYGPNSTWREFFSVGLQLLHEPSRLFGDYKFIISQFPDIIKADRRSSVADLLRRAEELDPVYALSMHGACNSLVPSEFFSIQNYYALNPRVCEADFPAHPHLMLSGAYYENKVTNNEIVNRYRHRRSDKTATFVSVILEKLNQLIAPENHVQFILAHAAYSRTVEEIMQSLGIDINRAPEPSTERKPSNEPPGLAERDTDADVEYIRSRGLFDVDWYLSKNPDVAASDFDPLWHYVKLGEQEGRWPNSEFDPTYYLRVNGDVRVAGVPPFIHYIDSGRSEGRHGTKPAWERAIKDTGETLVFVGHDAILAGAQRVLLNIIEWNFENTNRKICTILLGSGQLTQQYEKYGEVLTVSNPETEHRLIAEFLQNRTISLVYANTVVAGKFFNKQNLTLLSGVPVVAHIHELRNVINVFEAEFRNLRACVDYWICASDPIEAYLQEECGIKSDCVSTIRAFITPKVSRNDQVAPRISSRSSLNVPDTSKVIAGCGTAYHRKGVDIFVATALEYIRRHESDDVYFIWIGDGSDRQRLENFVSRAGLTKRIFFTGFRDDADIIISAADLFLLSSREDPFPLVVLEAAQYSVPSLCVTGVTGITAFVEGSGFVEQSLDHRVLADAIREILCDTTALRDAGSRAKEKLFAEYTSALAMQRIEQVLSLFLRPAVTVIVPNYNHEKYIEQRLNSVLNQTLKNIEVIVLDDKSTDRSVAVIESFCSDKRLRTRFNDANSGSVFSQWRLGLMMARSDLVWIAESDDYSDPSFLATLLPLMEDQNTVISFCGTVIVDGSGNIKRDVLRPYLSRSEKIDFDSRFKMSGLEFVKSGFGAMCTIVNASSALIRTKVALKSLPGTGEFRMCGDWYIYLKCLKAGDVAYTPAQLNFFRRHDTSAVHRLEGTDVYFSERLEIALHVADNYRLDEYIAEKIVSELSYEIERFHGRFEFDGNLYLDGLRKRLAARNSLKRGRKLGFYVHGVLFSRGGIERLAAQVLNFLSDNGDEIVLFCAPRGSIPVYHFRPDVKIVPIQIDSQDGENALSERLRAEQIQIMVPMLSEHLFEHVIRAAKKASVPVLASEHNDPWEIEARWWSRAKRQEYFSECAAVHLLLPKFRKSLDIPNRFNTYVVPNGVDLSEFKPGLIGREKRIICAARLAAQKSIDLAIRAFAQTRFREEGWEFHVFGDGELRSDLTDLIEQCGVQDSVFLRGISDDLSPEYAASEIFVLPSLFEGFGIVVVEALACGLPVVAYSDCNGPNEIVRDGVDGILIKERSVSALARSLDELMADEEKRRFMRFNAISRAHDFDLNRTLSMWDAMLNSVLRSAASRDNIDGNISSPGC